MPVYLMLTSGTLMAAVLTKSNPKPHSRQNALNAVCLTAIFLALFFVSALRIDVGNDYYWYTNIMHEASVYGHVPTEAGFNALVRAVFSLFGYENSLFVFALFSFATVLFFLWALYRYSDFFALSFAMFLLTGYYFQSLSTMRYYAVLPLSLFALSLCEKKDVPRFILLTCAGALFHKSILCVLVFYPLACMKWKKWMAPVAAGLGIAIAALPAFWTDLAVKLYPTYENVAFERGTLNVLNVARCVLVLLFTWYFAKPYLLSDDTDDPYVRHMRVWTKLSVMGLLFYVCGWFLPQISRIGYYLTLPQLLLVPAVVKRIADDHKRKWAIAAVLVFCLLYFVRYMLRAGNDGILILPYRSFLFAA